MIFTDLVRAAALGTIPIAYAFDALTIHQLYVVAFVTETMTVFFHVACSSLFLPSPIPKMRELPELAE